MPDEKKPLHLSACDADMPLIGGPVPSGNGVYMELRLRDHLSTIKPTDYGVPSDWPSFDPHAFFKTTGEAVAKTRYMLEEFKRRAHQVDSLVAANSHKRELAYQQLAWACVLNAADLLASLVEVRGDAVHLETTWGLDHVLTCRRTNPRDKSGE
jgi:hypothetical protein